MDEHGLKRTITPSRKKQDTAPIFHDVDMAKAIKESLKSGPPGSAKRPRSTPSPQAEGGGKKRMVEEDEVVIGGGAAAAIVPATAAVTQAVAPAAAISYACTVCASSETYDGNPIVMCDGCNVAVHLWCYGLTEYELPEGDWFCQWCTHKNKGKRMPKKKCMVCPVKDGAVHLATVGHSKLQQFVHVCCAIQLKAESYKIFINDEAIRGLSLIAEKNLMKCTVCGQAGGGVVGCNYHDAITELVPDPPAQYPVCPILMHVTCARAMGWHHEADPFTGLPIVCCSDHSTPRSVLRLHGERSRYAKRLELGYDPVMAAAEAAAEAADLSAQQFVTPWPDGNAPSMTNGKYVCQKCGGLFARKDGLKRHQEKYCKLMPNTLMDAGIEVDEDGRVVDMEAHAAAFATGGALADDEGAASGASGGGGGEGEGAAASAAEGAFESVAGQMAVDQLDAPMALPMATATATAAPAPAQATAPPSSTDGSAPPAALPTTFAELNTWFRTTLREVRAHDDKWPFAEPVDPDEVPDYYEVIKDPVDLMMIQDRIKDKYYLTREAYVADFTKMFDNCRKYNSGGNEYTDCAVRLQHHCSKVFARPIGGEFRGGYGGEGAAAKAAKKAAKLARAAAKAAKAAKSGKGKKGKKGAPQGGGASEAEVTSAATKAATTALIAQDEAKGRARARVMMEQKMLQAAAQARRAGFLSEHWDKFAPFLNANQAGRTSSLARACLGKYATDDKAAIAALVAAETIAFPLPTAQPSSVVGGKMRPYQIEGLRWLVARHGNAVGGILGDEMGLGKTMQVCSFLTHLKTDLKVDGPFLCVCPLSVLETWVNELRRWCPSLRTVRYHGSERERNRMRSQELREGFFDVLVTSYETLVADPSLFRHSKFVWRYVVLDEAQRIKNEQTLLGRAVRYLRASGKLLLTGTPLQNNLRELWALLNFLFPDVLKDAAGFEVESNNVAAITAAQALLKPLMLRRTKKSIGIDIPPKTEVRVLAPLSSTQRAWYKKVLDKDAGLLSLLGQNSGGSAASFTKLSNMLMQLRKVASHPWLLPGAEPVSTGLGDARIVTDSGKMVILDKLLTKIKAEGRKTVVFSQFTMVLDIIHDYLEFRGFGFFRLDGSTAAAKRRYVMAQFLDPSQSDKFVFLVSTRAGGLGLNLQAADSVILFDQDWNPQADLQAQDRVHRLGQKNPVTIYRFVSEGTCEERIMKFAERKLELSQGILQDHQRGLLEHDDDAADGAAGGGGLSRGDMAEMVRFGADGRDGATDEMYQAVMDMDIDDILYRKKTKEKVEWKEEVREFEGEKMIRGNSKTTEEEWAAQAQASGGARRAKKSTVVNMTVEGMSVNVSAWSIEAAKEVERKLKRQADAVAERERLKQARKAAPRLETCVVCRKPGNLGPDDDRMVCRKCPAVAHPNCAINSKHRLQGYSCPHHCCCTCGKVASDAGGLLLRCVKCPRSFCDDCIDGFKAVDEDPALAKIGWKKSNSVVLIECTRCTVDVKSPKSAKAKSVSVKAAEDRPGPTYNFYGRYLKTYFKRLDTPPWLW